MKTSRSSLAWGWLMGFAGLVILLMLAAISQSAAQDWQDLLATEEEETQSVVLPLIDASRGRRLFVVKGCVLCHSVNGVGGQAAPALDGQAGGAVRPLEFAARMWRGADAMLQLQATELGDFISLSGSDIGNLAGFIADKGQKEAFSLDEVPEVVREWMIDDLYWESESWPEDWGRID